MATLLIVEDDEALADQMFLDLKEDGHTVHVAHSLSDGMSHMQRYAPEIILTDLYLNEESGLDLLRSSRRLDPIPDVLLITAHPSSASASEAMSLGAYEYLQKPFTSEELKSVTHRICTRREWLEQPHGEPQDSSSTSVIADHPAMQEVIGSLQKVADRNTTVLLLGETGTGKDVLSRYLHEIGPHADAPYVAVNCAALPETLLASELFGHEKGAFTGAANQRMGAFERANHGTLLLDEIGDISLETQAHLLRVLESRELQRVGGDRTVTVQVRVVAATHRDLEAMVQAETFRQDLYYRLNVYPITVPPLRQRIEDIPNLVKHFLARLNATNTVIDEAGLQEMQSYDWPGNLRELRNVVENLAIRYPDGTVPAETLRQLLLPLRAPSQTSGNDTLAEVEMRRIYEALSEASGNKSLAAKRLGITRRKLYSRMKLLGIGE